MSGGARAVAGLSVAFLLASCAPSPADDDAGADRAVVTTIGIGFETLVGVEPPPATQSFSISLKAGETVPAFI